MEGGSQPSITSTPQDPASVAYSYTRPGQAKVSSSAPNGPFPVGPGPMPQQPAMSFNQWAGDSGRMQPAGNVNGFTGHGQARPPPMPNANSSGTTMPNPRPPFPLSSATPSAQHPPPVNGSGQPHNYPPQPGISNQLQGPGATPSRPALTSQPAGAYSSASVQSNSSKSQGPGSNYDPNMSRPNELPVPFHGQGQYSHQVNPLMQKTPIQTPGNSEPPSEKSSRGPSPISGSTIDALEGQFTPGHGAPSPLFPLNRGSPLSGSPVPGTPPSGTPPKANATRAATAAQLPQQQQFSSLQQPSGAHAAASAPLRMAGPSSYTQPQQQSGLSGQSQMPSDTHNGNQQQQPPFGAQPPPSGAPGAFTSVPQPGSNFQPPGPPRGNAPQHFLPSTSASTIPGFPPVPAGNAPGFPPPPRPSAPGFPPTTSATARFPPASNIPRFPPTSNTAALPPSATPAPGFPPASSAPGFAPNANASRFPLASNAVGFPPPSTNAPRFAMGSSPAPTMPRFPPAPASGAAPGFPPAPASNAQRYPLPPTPMYTGYPRPPNTNAAGYPPPPTSSTGSYPPPPTSSAASYPPPPNSSASGLPHPSGFPPPPQGQSSFPPTSQTMGQMPPSTSGMQYGTMPPGPSQGTTSKYPTPQYMQPGPEQMGAPMAYPNNMNNMNQSMGQMRIQDSQQSVNLLNERHLIGPEGAETARPTLPHDFKKVNCSPDIFRCTLNAIPQTSSLLNKARLPLGILIHPFKDLSQLPVIQSSVIVRCRSCRTYINPFVVFVDQRRWKCNLCFRVNDLPDEFSFDPVTKTYGDCQRRPEVKSATIEFIAPSEYMLRPPQPAVYLYLLDVSFNAIETGYLTYFCQILLDELDKVPGDARTSIGFLCYDKSLYYFNLAEGLSQPQMLVVPDLEDPFLPCPDNLLVNLHESKELVVELLNQLPSLFEGNHETGSALGAALQASHKLMSPTGGRITVMQTCLPTVGPGALENREVGGDSGKNVSNIGPATDFYKKLSLDCSAQQIAVDLFMLNGQYADLASLSCISKYSAGCISYYPSFHAVRNPEMVDKFESDLRRYLTRKIGFESVMRIRCTRGLSIHTFHGNFFVRSTDLLSLPNINPDAGFGMQMSIEDNLQESSTISFQAALLYTSSKGERRIRVHTLCVPVTNQLNEVFAAADQQAIAALLAKMAVDRSLNSAISDARDAMMNASLDALGAYSQQVPASQRASSTILAPHSLRLMPMYMLAMLKSVAFSLAGNSKLDTRVFTMQQCKTMPMCYLIQMLYPHLYPLHKLSDENPIKRGKEEIPRAPLLQLSSANIERTGLFLMDTGEAMYLLVGSAVGDQMCQDVFEKPNFASIPDGMTDLPELENPTSEKIRSYVNYLMDSRPNGVTFLVIRDDSKHRHLFFQHMLEDRTENSMSYYEFLQFLQGKAKG